MNSHFICEEIKKSFSEKRFEKYKRNDNDEVLTLTRCLWNVSLCESFYPILHNLEIALRNGIHHTLNNHFGDELWMVNHRQRFSINDEKSLIKAEEELIRTRKPIEAGRLVAELSFGFWTSLFSRHYEIMFWRNRDFYRTIFLNLPATHRNRGFLADRFNKIRKFRNRIFHHERIIHHRLQETHDSIIEVIDWLNPTLKIITSKIDRFPTVYSNNYFDNLKNEIDSLY
jgi:hypothetical protein